MPFDATTSPAQVDPSQLQPQDGITDNIFTLRKEIKRVATMTKQVIERIKDTEGGENEKGEMIASAMLAFRHLEDSAMRLGKVLQAKNGGVSILSK